MTSTTRGEAGAVRIPKDRDEAELRGDRDHYLLPCLGLA
jgi:hypothetical protein